MGMAAFLVAGMLLAFAVTGLWPRCAARAGGRRRGALCAAGRDAVHDRRPVRGGRRARALGPGGGARRMDLRGKRAAGGAAIDLVRTAFPDRPAFDTAVSRAILERVARGELPETFRLARPGAMVAFGKQDVTSPGYPTRRPPRAPAASRRSSGWPAVAPPSSTSSTIAFAWAGRAQDTWSGTHDRFRDDRGDRRAARCGGSASTRASARSRASTAPATTASTRAAQTKLAGIGQRLIKGALAHRRRDRGRRGRARARHPGPRLRGARPGLGPGDRRRRRGRGSGRRLGGRRGRAARTSCPTHDPAGARRRDARPGAAARAQHRTTSSG